MTCSPNFTVMNRHLPLLEWYGTDSWKYVYNPYSEDELYDMKSDPHELHNLANHPRLQTCASSYESAYG